MSFYYVKLMLCWFGESQCCDSIELHQPNALEVQLIAIKKAA